VTGTPHHAPSRYTDQVPIGDLLSGGDPRTLRSADEVVETVLAEPERLDELIRCVLDSPDNIVRMRAGDALEKVCRAQPSLLQPHVSLLLGDLSTIHQPSVQWHVAQMLGHVRLSAAQRRRAAGLMNNNLDESTDWIVLNCSLETLAVLARADPSIVEDLRRQLGRHEQSSYKSLANRAGKLRLELGSDPSEHTR
jgi:HEAT repeat protein